MHLDFSGIDFVKYNTQLDALVSASNTMDEQTFRLNYELSKCDLPLVYQPPIDEEFSLYRARLARNILPDEDLNCPQTFSYVPVSKVTGTFPGIGRANYSGQSIFYASFSPTTNFREIDADVKAGEEVFLSRWKVSKDSRLNLYRVFPKESFDDDNYSGLLKVADKELANSELGVFLRRLGELFMNTEEGKSKYLPTAYIANYILRHKILISDGNQRILLGYSGLVYPSTKDNSGKELNVAIIPSFINKHAELEVVWKGRVAEDIHSIKFSSVGFCKKGRIKWYIPYTRRDDIKPIGYSYIDTDNRIVDVSNGILRDRDGQIVLDMYAVFYDHFDEWCNAFMETFGDTLINKSLSDITDLKSLQELNKYEIAFDLGNWTYQDSGKTHNIARVVYFVEIHTSTKEVKVSTSTI